MTLEGAKKILEKEGFVPEQFLGVLVEDVKAASWEKIEVGEAMKVVAENGYFPFMEKSKYEERKARLKKEYEENIKAPGSAENRIKEDSDVNPALEESASQFNDALLDEQAKKIKELTEEIARLNKVIYKKNLKIEEFRKESSRYLRGEVKMFVENGDLKKSLRKTESLLHDISEANSRNLDTCFKNEDLIDELKKKLAEKTKLAKKYAKELSDSSLGLCKLEKQLKDKNAILSDVAEELRLSKIREKNLTESCQKYIKANEELKEKLANKVVDKIDAQALKSAESALAWKEKVIAEKDMALAYNEKEIADLQEKLKSIYKNRHIERVYKKKLVEKDEVIDNLHKELKAQKGLVNHISKKYDGAKINLNLRMKECEKLKEALDEANKHQQQAYRSCTDKNKEIRALKLQISALEKRGNGIDWKHNADAIKLYVNRASHERLWNPISQDICNEKELSFIINHGGKRVKYALHFDGTDIVYECSDPDKKNNDLMVGVDIAEEGADLSGVIVLCGKNLIDAIKKMK